MSRVEELRRMIDKVNEVNNNDGTFIDEWTMLLLTDIAYSLAIIADKMTEGEKDESD